MWLITHNIYQISKFINYDFILFFTIIIIIFLLNVDFELEFQESYIICHSHLPKLQAMVDTDILYTQPNLLLYYPKIVDNFSQNDPMCRKVGILYYVYSFEYTFLRCD